MPRHEAARRPHASDGGVAPQSPPLPMTPFRNPDAHGVARARRVVGLLFAILVLPLLAALADTAGSWEAGDGFRRRPLQVSAGTRTGFLTMTPDRTGVAFTNVLEERHSLTNHIYLNGSGVAAGDVDGDGLVDLYFCRLNGPNALYRNRGDWRFEEVTSAAGVGCDGQYSTGAVLADIDGDGHLDLLVCGIGTGTRLFLNNGTGRFTETTDRSGLASTHGSMSMALGDVDGNGTLDLYVANYRTWTMRDAFNLRLSVRVVDGRPVVTRVFGRPVTDPDLVGRFTIGEDGNLLEHGEVDAFLLNDGTGRFRQVPFDSDSFRDETGTPLPVPPRDWGLSVQFRDINGDGLPDIYVCNDFHSPDRMWINRGDGSFQAVSAQALRKGSWFSMGVDFGDLDRDGHDDFLVVDMLSRDHVKRHVQVGSHMRLSHPSGDSESRPHYPRNTLHWNRGDGTWLEAAHHAGLHAAEWAWSPVFLDVDLDGFEDVLVTTGFERDVQDADVAAALEEARTRERLPDSVALAMRRQFPRLDDPNLAFRNLADRRFEEAGEAWGFNHPGISQGIALADLDGDGDLDAVVNNMNGPALLLQNTAPAPRVAVQLVGLAPNTRGIGAKVRLLGGPAPQSQEMLAGGRYLSSDAPTRTFAAGTARDGLVLEVEWPGPDPVRTVIHDVVPNSLYEVRQAGASRSTPSAWARAFPPTGPARPLFDDASDLLAHRHTETPFDDFARQPLLPRQLSRLGPGVAWFDINGDGWEDLLVGTGAGGYLSALLNDRGKAWTPFDQPDWQVPLPVDQTGILGFHKPDGSAAVLTGVASQEAPSTAGPALLEYRPDQDRPGFFLPDFPASAGPLALTSWGGTSDLLLFIGGRSIPGRYPESAPSLILRLTDGSWQVDPALSAPLADVGLVSGATWTDLDRDGFPDLALACEWGPVRIFWHRDGALDEATGSFGLGGLTGWWNGVAAGDFNGDGLMDLVASNWGSNTRHQPHRGEGIRLYHGDFLDRGAVDILEAWHLPGRGWVPWRVFSSLAPALPFIPQRFPSHRALGGATIDDILGDLAPRARIAEARVLESHLLLNRGGLRLDPRPLPDAAQWAPAFAACIADFDGDGREDLFLGQNFSANDPNTERYDAGRGALLLGDGDGGFTPVDARASGISIPGEQRGAAVGDFDHDGRPDLVVTQNGAPTRLYRNQGGRPGLRLHLHGPPRNPDALGAVVRAEYADGGIGPAREIRAGSGYWSQDALIQVLARPQPVRAVLVRWPGEASPRRLPLPPDARSIRVRHPDTVEVIP